tara:strand:- start:372 stop:581 length:210 start_codon:yes stop_codon:yes gene_type:complete
MKYKLEDIKQNILGNDHLELDHDDHTIVIWHLKDRFSNNRLRYFLEFNGRFVKSGFSLNPIITKLNKII